MTAVAQNPALFASTDAMAELGVGKNMVDSIRHWCVASGLIDGEKRNGLKTGYMPTALASALMLEEKWDSYFEDAASLWLIHWMIASRPYPCTTWHWLFNHWHGLEFTKEQVFKELNNWAQKHGLKQVSESTLTRDIDVCLRTYVQARHARASLMEETLDCPLTELGLIHELHDGKSFRFTRGEQPTLPNEILLFAINGFLEARTSKTNSLALEQLLYSPGSPGRVFKLSEDSMVRRLEGIAELTKGDFRYDETAGMKQLYVSQRRTGFAWLQQYYVHQ